LSAWCAGQVDPLLVADAELRDRVAALVKDVNGRWNRIRSLATMVQHEISNFSDQRKGGILSGILPHPPSLVLRQGRGDCKDKAGLMVAMLRVLGEQAYCVFLNRDNPKAVSEEWPGLSTFDHVIVAIPADADLPPGWPVLECGPAGRLVLLDVTDSSSPLGALPAVELGGAALVLAPQSGTLVRIPADIGGGSRLGLRGEGRVDGDGVLRLKVMDTRQGSLGASRHWWRFTRRREDLVHALEARVQAAMVGSSVAGVTVAWDEAKVTDSLGYEVAAPGVLQTAGKLVLFSPYMLAGSPSLPAWGPGHEGWVRLDALVQEEELDLELPAGFVMEKLPADWSATDVLMTGSLSYRIEGQRLLLRATRTQKGALLGRQEYDQLGRSLQKFEAMRRRPLLLRRAPEL